MLLLELCRQLYGTAINCGYFRSPTPPTTPLATLLRLLIFEISFLCWWGRRGVYFFKRSGYILVLFNLAVELIAFPVHLTLAALVPQQVCILGHDLHFQAFDDEYDVFELCGGVPLPELLHEHLMRDVQLT